MGFGVILFSHKVTCFAPWQIHWLIFLIHHRQMATACLAAIFDVLSGPLSHLSLAMGQNWTATPEGWMYKTHKKTASINIYNLYIIYSTRP